MIFRNFLANIRQLDWGIIVSALILCAFGLEAIYSTSFLSGNFLNFKKQLIFIAIGFLAMIIMSFFDWRFFKSHSSIIIILYFICLALLGGLFFFKAHRGIKSWYDLGFFYFNPIELLKIVLIILLAKYFSKRHAEMYNAAHVVISGLYVAVPCALIFFQPDLGSVMIIIALWLGVLFVSGIKPQHLLALILVGAISISLGWSFGLRDYQRQRIISFANPQADALKTGWNQNQAEIAIGSGGWFGKGIGNGSQGQLGFLPEPQTDFIFCVIAEEMGLIGVIVLLSAFLYFVGRIISIALHAPDNFSRLFAAGFCISICAQALINLAMNVRLFPIVGIPLPLVSYGGSNLIFTFAAIGILQSIKANEIR